MGWILLFLGSLRHGEVLLVLGFLGVGVLDGWMDGWGADTRNMLQMSAYLKGWIWGFWCI